MKGVFCAIVLVAIFFSEFIPAYGGLGDWCDYDNDCYVLSSVCIDGFCACRENHVPSDDSSQCLLLMNHRCPWVTSICNANNATCQYVQTDTSRHLYCLCNNGLVYNPTLNRCLIGFGGTCADGSQCITDFCGPMNNQCVCQNFDVPSSDQLSCLTDLGGDCRQKACADDNAVCTSGVCSCAPHYQVSPKIDGNMPRRCRKRLNTDCSRRDDCADISAECLVTFKGSASTTKCICDEGFVPNEDRSECLKEQRKFGGNCTSSRQCTAVFGADSTCQNNQCVCLRGTYNPQLVSCSVN